MTHRSHRLSHIVLMNEGDVFPQCRRCYDDVRFELYMRIQRLGLDRDFAEPEEDVFGTRPVKSKDGSKPKVVPFRHPQVR